MNVWASNDGPRASGRAAEGVDVESLRDRLRADFLRLSEEATSATSESAHYSRAVRRNVTEDDGDTAVHASKLDYDASVSRNTQQLLRQTATALHRIDLGLYGSCESCGGAIGAARLDAFPAATMCVHCRELADHH